MKIGILTFHSQLNYGGVLQCLALKKVLEILGHEVMVLDRWCDAENEMLLQGCDLRSAGTFLRNILRMMAGCGHFSLLVRVIRTKKFLKRLNVSPYHFYRWGESPQDLGVDAVVVGSDQVWHGGDWGDPEVYLLKDAPVEKAISYAASFGMNHIPCSMLDLYKEGLRRFSKISCRENEGVRICQELGFVAQHVSDPTLLLDRKDWLSALDIGISPNEKVLVCYFLSEDISLALPALERYAEKAKCHVEVFTNGWLKRFPYSLGGLVNNYKRFRNVKVRLSAGPREFVKAIAEASDVITDSFHGVMFASIFDVNTRFIRPRSAHRAGMFARVSEFSGNYIKHAFYADTLSDALLSIASEEKTCFDQEGVNYFTRTSLEWLDAAIKELTHASRP